jgi:hypothetical protein
MSFIPRYSPYQATGELKSKFSREAGDVTGLRKEKGTLGDLRGHEKKSKNHQNCYFGLNKIKYLQLWIFAKRDFFSRPAPLR